MGQQFKLSRVQVVNWGTFDGYFDIPVGEKGFLITGASGSGKSTLIDAFSTILVPYNKVRYNAAAQQDTGRDKGRNRVSYIRGAWRRNENAATGDIRTEYLRNGATASIIAMTYRGGDETITLVAIFRLNAGQYSNDQVRSLYGILPLDVDVREFTPLLANALDKRKLEQRYKTKGSGVTFTDQYSVFANRFRAKLGIGSEEAQMLLHRTQSAKSLNSMDELFREYMLEEPSTFAIAEEAVATHGDLRHAYERLEDIQRQIETLSPLPGLSSTLKQATAEQAEAEAMIAALPTMQRSIEAAELQEAVEVHEAEHAALEVQVESLASRKAAQRDAESRAATQRSQFTAGQVQYMEKEIGRSVDVLAQRRTRASSLTAALDLEQLDTDTFSRLKAQAKRELEHADEEREALMTERAEATARARALAQAEEPLRSELKSLGSRSSNIDEVYVTLRAELCKDLGLSPLTLPYVGELIDVLPEHAEWEPVIQRLLSGFAITLLVPEEFERSVSGWVNARHLGRRLEYRTVPEGIPSPRRPRDAASLIHKVEVVDHAVRPWLETMLTSTFDYQLVRSVAELERSTRRAATIDGLERNPTDKTGSNRYVKNDRRRLGNTRDYRLGSSNDVKIEALRAELKQAEAETRAAKQQLDELVRRQRVLDVNIKHAELVADTEWSEVDTAAVEALLADLRAELERLTSSPEAKQLEQAYQQAREALEATEQELVDAQKRMAVVENSIADNRERLTQAQAWLKRERPVIDDAVYAALESRLRSRTRRVTLNNLSTIIDDTRVELEAQLKRASDAITRTNARISNILASYIATWPAESAELQADPSFAGEAIKRLELLRGDRLPEFRERFLDLLNGQSVMHLSQIYTQLNRAKGDIETGLEPINASLRRSPYTIGDDGPRYLQIKVNDNRGPEVKEFLKDLREATSGSLSAADEKSAIERYHRLAKIMDRLGSAERADDRWRKLVLDTRRHVNFVGNEVDEDGNVFSTHVDSASLSGGQAQKLVFFCLAAALRYRLAGVDAEVPTYATVVLDEAFDRADPMFTRIAMDVFTSFGFHMILATPMKLIKTLSPYVDGTIVINYTESPKPRSTFAFVDLTATEGTGAPA